MALAPLSKTRCFIKETPGQSEATHVSCMRPIGTNPRETPMATLLYIKTVAKNSESSSPTERV